MGGSGEVGEARSVQLIEHLEGRGKNWVYSWASEATRGLQEVGDLRLEC